MSDYLLYFGPVVLAAVVIWLVLRWQRRRAEDACRRALADLAREAQERGEYNPPR